MSSTEGHLPTLRRLYHLLIAEGTGRLPVFEGLILARGMEAGMASIRVDAGRIVDRDSFHQVFLEAMGFPEPYGQDMDAWIDGMSHLGDPGAGGVLVIEIAKVVGFKSRCPEQFAELVECTALVNHRFVEEGQPPRLALLFL